MKTRPFRTFIIFLTALAAPACALQACSSSNTEAAPGPGCEIGPGACGAGTTCWPKECTCLPGTPDCGLSNCTPRLACLPSAPGKKPHDPCNDTVGMATCSDHQACVEFAANRGGCLTYCDDTKPNRGCAAQETCVDEGVGQIDGGPTIHVCAVIGGDGGTDGGATPDDAGAIGDVRSELPN